MKSREQLCVTLLPSLLSSGGEDKTDLCGNPSEHSDAAQQV